MPTVKFVFSNVSPVEFPINPVRVSRAQLSSSNLHSRRAYWRLAMGRMLPRLTGFLDAGHGVRAGQLIAY